MNVQIKYFAPVDKNKAALCLSFRSDKDIEIFLLHCFYVIGDLDGHKYFLELSDGRVFYEAISWDSPNEHTKKLIDWEAAYYSKNSGEVL